MNEQSYKIKDLKLIISEEQQVEIFSVFFSFSFFLSFSSFFLFFLVNYPGNRSKLLPSLSHVSISMLEQRIIDVTLLS